MGPETSPPSPSPLNHLRPGSLNSSGPSSRRLRGTEEKSGKGDGDVPAGKIPATKFSKKNPGECVTAKVWEEHVSRRTSSCKGGLRKQKGIAVRGESPLLQLEKAEEPKKKAIAFA